MTYILFIFLLINYENHYSMGHNTIILFLPEGHCKVSGEVRLQISLMESFTAFTAGQQVPIIFDLHIAVATRKSDSQGNGGTTVVDQPFGVRLSGLVPQFRNKLG